MNNLKVEHSSALFCSNMIQRFFENVTDITTDPQLRITLSSENDEYNRTNEKILYKILGKH